MIRIYIGFLALVIFIIPQKVQAMIHEQDEEERPTLISCFIGTISLCATTPYGYSALTRRTTERLVSPGNSKSSQPAQQEVSTYVPPAPPPLIQMVDDQKK